MNDSRAPANHPIPVSLDRDWVVALDRAAEKRGMNRTAYARRAMMAMVVHDLGLDWVKLMADEPRVSGFGELTMKTAPRYAGFGFGSWRIVSLEEYRSERSESRADDGELDAGGQG